MKKITVKGVLKVSGTSTIEIADNKITLLCGDNEQGKTTFITLAKALMIPRALPPNLTVKDYGPAVVNDAVKEGTAKLEAPGLVRSVSYPACEVKTLQGSASIKFDEWAAQEMRLMDLKPAARAKCLAEMAGAKPTRKEVDDELEPLNITKEHQKKLVDVFMSSGPETAATVAMDFARELKQEFKTLTGEQWYAVKGMNFKPNGYTDDLAEIATTTLEEELKVATNRYQDARDKAALYRAAGDKAALQEEVEKWTATVLEREVDLAKAQSWHDHQESAKRIVTCEGCGLTGIVAGSKLTKAVLPEAEEGELTLPAAKAALSNAQMALGLAKGNLDKAEGLGEYVDVAPFREAVELAHLRLQAATIKLKSIALHYRVADMLKAVEVVSPDGIAKAKLLIGIKGLNKTLRTYSNIAGWDDVQLDADLNLRFDNRIYHPAILSEGARFKADTTFQLAYCVATRQELMCVDRAELLDDAGRDGLLMLLRELHATALVGMMCAPSGAFDLAEHGLGRTYVMVNGEAKSVAEAQEA